MTKIKYFLLVFLTAIVYSTNGYAKDFKGAICTSIVEVEKDGVSGKVITTLYLGKKHKVEVYKSVLYRDKLEISPYLYASGKYHCKGNKKKGLNINLDLKNLMNENITYSGLVLDNGLVLLMPDNSVQAYAYIKEVLFHSNND